MNQRWKIWWNIGLSYIVLVNFRTSNSRCQVCRQDRRNDSKNGPNCS